MKEITNILKSYLDKHFSKKISISNVEFSNKSKSFLSKIINLMNQSEIAFENTVIESKILDIYPKGNSFEFTPDIIKNEIENMNKKCIQYTFLIGKRTFNISFVYPKNTTTVMLQKYIKRVFMWLFIATFFAPKKCSQHMNIYLYLTSIKKFLPNKKGEFIDEQHANTAFTTSCKKNTEIYIYREEEWFKVLIHETFHNLGLDFSEYDNTKSSNCISKIFPIPIQTNIRLFETYCEMWGEIINSIFISYFSTRHVENLEISIPRIIQKTAFILTYEKLFSLFQCAKVLHYFNITYKNLYETTSYAQKLRTQYKEKTQILSYYILKSIYMFHVNSYIEWCDTNNNSSINFNKGSQSLEKNIESYCGFIREHYQNEEYIETIGKLEKWLLKDHKPTIENQTLRMTMFEL